jgi:intracellular septation protein A
MFVETRLKGLNQQKRTIFTLVLIPALFFFQLAGLHFHHAHQYATWNEPPLVVVQVEYSHAHIASHKKSGAIDRSVAEFWKSPDQDWNVLALLVGGFVLLLPVVSRYMWHIPWVDIFPFKQPEFLRPSLRAPPF